MPSHCPNTHTQVNARVLENEDEGSSLPAVGRRCGGAEHMVQLFCILDCIANCHLSKMIGKTLIYLCASTGEHCPPGEMMDSNHLPILIH